MSKTSIKPGPTTTAHLNYLPVCIDTSSNNEIEVIDNFLSDDEFLKIKNIIYDRRFSWHYSNNVSFPNDGDFQFSNFLQAKDLDFILKKIQAKKIYRIKINQVHKTKNIVIHQPHVDQHFDCKAMILYINSNNGYTYFDDEKIYSVENRAVFFRSSMLHGGTTCTDEKRRILLNINYV